MNLYTTEGKLFPIAPFDFTKSLSFLGSFSPMRGEQETTTQTLTKAVSIEGQVVAFQLHSLGTVEEPQIAYTLFSEAPLSKEVTQQAIDRVRFFLSMDDDVRPFYQIGFDDPDFTPVLRDLYGYHQVKFLTPFESACWAVLTQRNPVNVAHQMKQRLIQAYGGSITLDGTNYWAFPEATHLTRISEAELAPVIRNTRKVEYLLATISAFSNVDEQFLRTGNYDEVASWLRRIKGFGEWSTTFVLLRGLGRMEYIIPAEKEFQRAAARVYAHGKELSTQGIAAIAEKYGSHQGYWMHYLRVGA